ncbi:MAG: C39 family peptidase [Myxococcaceae bacterium]
MAFAVALPRAAFAAPYADALIEGVPHVKQKPDFCGEADAEMYLQKLGKKVTQDDVFDRAGVDPLLGRGAYTNELARSLRSFGFEVGPVWYSVDPARADEQIEAQWRALHQDLLKGVPSIICTHYSDEPDTTEHFRLVLGYRKESDEVVYHEPAEANGAYRRMKRELFLKLWTFRYRPDRWTLIRMRLEPGQLDAAPAARGVTDADIAQHVLALKDKLPRGATLALERPFVIIGDEAPAKVAERAKTVRWAIDLLRKDFFPKDPPKLLDVWVFKDRRSYESNARALFGSTPQTPYGYYLEEHRALVMNIAPGYGTLVHELVHPFIEANVPAAPPWINEGLASLYERPAEVKGHLVGLSNWRLPGLKAAIKARTVPSFARLTAMDAAAFYEDDEGTHYAQARYLCQYLQEKGQLVDLVRRLRERGRDDPSGYGALQAALGEKDMAAFGRRWELWASKLVQP